MLKTQTKHSMCFTLRLTCAHTPSMQCEESHMMDISTLTLELNLTLSVIFLPQLIPSKVWVTNPVSLFFRCTRLQDVMQLKAGAHSCLVIAG